MLTAGLWLTPPEVHDHASVAVVRRLGLRSAGVMLREGLVEGRPGLHADAPFVLYRWGAPGP